MLNQRVLGLLTNLGFGHYSGSVLLALAEYGRGGSAEIAKWSGVPRTSIYGIVSDLIAMGLVEEAGRGHQRSMTWQFVGWPRAVAAMNARESKRYRERMAQIGALWETVEERMVT